ncbi:MAG: hypothetical protein KatS3mg095_0590 [Candidatus Parcubacteria bacterium]|nr:MAG: hypothetical protein KatS3mg095_0590 [Candidatus Parcubacteria bacterium]
MKNKKFITVINCMDGRVQLPVNNWLRKRFQADFVDTITEPGPNRILATNSPKFLVTSIKKRVEISIKKHKSKLIAIVGHYDCAGNPVTKEKQIDHILKAKQKIGSWNLGVKIICLWVNEKWKVEEIPDLK